MNAANVSSRLKEFSHWLGWKYVTVDGRETKPPFNARTGRRCDAHDPANWVSFSEAVDAADILSGNGFEFAGIGFSLFDTPLIGCDFDGVLDDGHADPYVLEILKHLGDPATEISPSGNGLRCFVECPTLPTGKRKFNAKKPGIAKFGIEIYSGSEPGRYLTITGDHFSGEGVPKLNPANIELPYLLISQFPNEKFKKLWMGDMSEFGDDQSRADQSLCNLIAAAVNYEPKKIEDFFSASKLGQREKWTERADYRERTIAKAIKGKEPKNVTVSSNEIEVRVVTNEQPDMPRSILTGRLGEICEQNLLTDFPVAYAWPALVTAASVLVPVGEVMHNLYTALIGPVNDGKSQCIEWAVKSLRVSDDPARYSEVKAGSAERLLRYMNRLRDAGKLAPYVLMALDEWKFFFDKAGIENSVFPTLLTTGFYKQNTSILDSHGHPIDVPAVFSWLGGVVTEVYDECFSRVTALGLYDRFLQGVHPSDYAGFNYRPFDGQVLSADFTPTHVTVDKSVWKRLKEWRLANPHATREAEIALRVAIICASFDGAALLAAKDLEPHLILATEQMQLRETFKPNSGETPDAQCAIKVENYARAHGPTGEWLDVRAMMKAIHYERFGPLVFERTIRGLSSLKIVELGDRRPSPTEKHAGGASAKVIRLVLE
jgi:hypothetical protein